MVRLVSDKRQLPLILKLRAWDSRMQRYNYNIHDLMVYHYDTAERFCIESATGLFAGDHQLLYAGDVVDYCGEQPQLLPHGYVCYDYERGGFVVKSGKRCCALGDYHDGHQHVALVVVGNIHQRRHRKSLAEG